jgi:poly-gamma-glutamate synthesis protein (capsule biosynthesis protein)
MRSVAGYVRIAGQASGTIPESVAPEYVWGDALEALAQLSPHLRIINLETAVTAGGSPWPGKGIHYRMHPRNVEVLRAAQVDVAVLANNHVLDWGRDGFFDTLQALSAAGVQAVGAGIDAAAASAPVRLAAGGRNVRVFAMAGPDSGVPEDWAAGEGGPGVYRLATLDRATARAEALRIRAAADEDDIVVVSIHWGSNWGYAVPAEHRRFARTLIEHGGVDIVHGHSSHHPRGMEVHHGRLILYGAGDLINDYEGIGGNEEFRPQLVALYLPELRADGALDRLWVVPLRMARFRLNDASEAESTWLQDTLARESRGVHVGTEAGRILVLPAD